MNDELYCFLILYYLEDLWNPPIYDEIMESPNQEEIVWKYIAAWVKTDDKVQAILKEKFAVKEIEI